LSRGKKEEKRKRQGALPERMDINSLWDATYNKKSRKQLTKAVQKKLSMK
jgi:hypothetical protein